MARAVFPHPIHDLILNDIHSNQYDFADQISKHFLDRSCLSLLALALTQSGKTGTMLSLVHHFMKHPDLSLPYENVFIITGLSSCEWLIQTKERFPTSLQSNVYHRNTLHKFKKNVMDKKNVLILIDETQVCFSQNQTIHTIFKELNMMDTNMLYKNDIKFVLFTATPLNPLDFKEYPFTRTLYMQPPKTYTSIFNLLENNRILMYKDLAGALPGQDYSSLSRTMDSHSLPVRDDVFDFIRELSPLLGSVPKFHIIRTKRASLHNLTILNFKKVFPHYLFVSSLDLSDTIQNFISTPPLQHTFLFIMDKLRCAQTIPKNHLGILYERFTPNPSLHSIVQGLAGRLTGYHSNLSSVVFTNPFIIRKYFHLWTNQFIHYRLPSILIGN